jgi:hypothetical protein
MLPVMQARGALQVAKLVSKFFNSLYETHQSAVEDPSSMGEAFPFSQAVIKSS